MHVLIYMNYHRYIISKHTYLHKQQYKNTDASILCKNIQKYTKMLKNKIIIYLQDGFKKKNS